MAIYYVRTDGNNDNDGLSYTISGAFKTIAKAISVVSAGDTVRIAPGTYYEVMVLSTAGSAGNIITWWGDKEAQYFLDLKPAPVRITGCDQNTGFGLAAILINVNNKYYNNFHNLSIDGTATGGNGILNACYTNIYDCVINVSSWAIARPWGLGDEYVNAYRCVIIAGYSGFYYATAHNCLIIGGYTCVGYSGKLYNCILIGGYGCIVGGIPTYNIYAYNCIAIGSYISYYSCYATNCISIGSTYTYYNSVSKKCKTLYGQYSAVGDITKADISYANCNTGNGGTEAKYEGYTDVSRLLKFATALRFDIAETGWSTDLHSLTVTGTTTPVVANNDYMNVGTYNGENLYQSIFKDHLIFNSTTLSIGNWVIQANATTTPDEGAANYAYAANLIGTYTNVGTWAGTTTVSTYSPIVFSENYDIMRHQRRMGNGTLDCGAFEYSDVSMEWNIYKDSAPALKISQAGEKRIVIPVKSGVEKTVKTWVYFSGTTLKPQLILSSSENILTTTGVTTTAVGTENTWEQLTATLTPMADGLLFIDFKCRETAPNTYAIFSNFNSS